MTEIQLDKLTADDLQTCDWGYCDGQAVAVRLDTSPTAPWDVWLSVCDHHSRDEPLREVRQHDGHDATKPWPACIRSAEKTGQPT